MTDIRELWTRKTWYRVMLVAAIVYATLRLALSVFYLFGGTDLDTGGQTGFVDLDVYLQTAEHVQQRADLYLTPEQLQEFPTMYLYTPTFALLLSWLSWIPPQIMALLSIGLHVIGYAALYVLWRQIFLRHKLVRAARMQAWALPLWLVYYSFWADMTYLNIHVFIALAVTALVDALLRKRLWLSWILTLALALTKPQWAIIVLVMLLLKQWRFFAKLTALTVVCYLAAGGLTILVLGLEYGWHQYVGYYRFLMVTMREYWPWQAFAEYGLFGSNHSIMQIVSHLIGVTPLTLILVAMMKAALISPLFVLGVRWVLRHAADDDIVETQAGLTWMFALSLAAVYVWLDVVWSDAFLLGIVIFAYIVAEAHKWTGRARMGLWALFAFYALTDMFDTGGYLMLGDNVLVADTYLIVSDPNIYFPFLLVLVLVFYGLLLRRVWRWQSKRKIELGTEQA